MRSLNLFFLCSLVLFCFQNCAEFKRNSFFDIYPYSSKPDFFYDVQLVSSQEDEDGLQSYIFDIAISYAGDPNEEVNYTLVFKTPIVSEACIETGTANGNSKHFRVECIVPFEDELYVQLMMAGPSAELEQNYKF